MADPAAAANTAAVAVRGANRPPTFVGYCAGDGGATCRGTSATAAATRAAATATAMAVTTTTAAVGCRRRQGRRIVALQRRSGRRRRRQGRPDGLELLLLGVVVERRQRRRRSRGTVLLLDHRMDRRDVVLEGLKPLHRLVALRTLQEAVRLGGAAALIILRQTGCQRWKLQGKLGG